MALKINNKLVEENIEDDNGNVLGTIKFDAKDERIMKTLSDIILDLGNKLDEIKKVGDIEDLPKEKIEKVEDFEKVRGTVNKMSKVIDLQFEAVKNAIDRFTDIFGKETMDIITCGSISLENLTPLIDFLTPYVQSARQKKVDKYLNDSSSVFE